MSHELWIEDNNGELIDVAVLCSDSCARQFASVQDLPYDGWNGAHEVETTTWCENCGVVIGGLDPECDHVYPVVVNLIGEPVNEYCKHGTLIRSSL